jgi:hypothetical protein
MKVGAREYSLGSSYDELIDADGSARPHAAELVYFSTMHRRGGFGREQPL